MTCGRFGFVHGLLTCAVATRSDRADPMRRPFPLLLLAALLPLGALAQTAAPLSLEQIMADPEWIGPAVEAPAWRWDGKAVQYQLKRNGSRLRDDYVQALDGDTPVNSGQRVGDAQLSRLDGADPRYDAARRHAVFVRNGDVFLRDLQTGALQQLTRTTATEADPRFAADGGVLWRSGDDWWHGSPDGSVAQVTSLQAAPDPDAAPADDALRDMQLHELQTLQRDRAQREEMRQRERQLRTDDPDAPPPAAYLGGEVEIAGSSLSPDARWLLVVTQKKGADAGRVGKLPHYVTESGYEETEDARTRVGRNPPVAQRLWLVDARTGAVRELKFDDLPGIKDDPLAALRRQAGKPALQGDREVQVMGRDDGTLAIEWNRDGDSAALMLRSVDNKDLWIAGIELAQDAFDKAKLQPRHHLHDAAWINWSFNDFGWLADNRTLWFLSEESGFSHLYLQDGKGKPRALTDGHWETSAPQLRPDGNGFLFLCNRTWPGKYEVCASSLDGGDTHELTALDGVESFAQSPDGKQLLVAYSRSYLPTQLAVTSLDGGEARILTDTRTAEFKAHAWLQPQFVQIPSKHGAGTIRGKFYAPEQLEAGRKYPLVMFVHGAGYLQNAIEGYTSYFREQMFNQLLVEHGYLVLDLDYRGSAGYGRDWRAAIYRDMGHPELDDYLDGLDWLVETRQGDRARAGIYGGSYGGFMTYMALFRAPGVFKAGAALRPVADWAQYNHEYTSNILNTPDIDPEAYRTSSPIEYASGLQDHLLIAHGMIDDNVFYRDTTMMEQKLIELHKDNWSVASYPLERHGFVRADSWLDEYRRVFELFEDNLK